MRSTLQALIASSQTIIADGGMGTTLFSMGLAQGASPELWNVDHPDKIRSVQRDYIQAGAQIILTNTFGCNRLRLKLHNLHDRVVELNQAAAKLAIAEAEAADHPVVVAGDIGPSGSLIVPLGDVTYEEMVDVFAEQAGALVEAGVDVIWVETMSAIEEVRAAVEGTRRVAPDFPIVTTMTFDTNGHTMMGISPEAGLRMMQELGVIALGGNCGNGPDELLRVIGKMRNSDPAQVLVAKGNAGIPHLEQGRPVYDGTPAIMADYAIHLRNLGANIIGACCGSTPEHIRQMKAALDSTPYEPEALVGAAAGNGNGKPARQRSRVRDRLSKEAG
jgi:5-methyltetrahydrofolate--homocysteine methyltransferase